MPADMIRDTEWAQELINEGRTEGLRHGLLQILRQRGVDGQATNLIAAALLTHDETTALIRAAFDDLEALLALAE
ncbi:hypothetical protein AB0M02_42415 [Actinoplanes sp. NPDC051861]|uniref:hypothetical protein n=1 Tax=Actinoplanes sp. NPDC051861 TaxID=3155170 RepID=UPI00341AADA2